jgi:hypothetical protein
MCPRQHLTQLTVFPVLQVSAVDRLFHHGQSTPRVQSRHGFPPQLSNGNTQSPLASGQNGCMHSQRHLSKFHIPYVHPLDGASHDNFNWADTVAMSAARSSRMKEVIIVMIVALLCSRSLCRALLIISSADGGDTTRSK